MKIRIILLLSLLPCIAFTQTIDKSKAIEIVKASLNIDSLSYVELYISNDTLSANTQIKTYIDNRISPDFTSWFFFVDDCPYANWQHSCRYAYVNIYDGSIVVKEDCRPPLLDSMDQIIHQKNKYAPDAEISKYDSAIPLRTLPIPEGSIISAKHNYAIIISGGCNKQINYERYWNDCSYMYKTLRNAYGYERDHIYVLISDGTDPALDMHRNNDTFISSPLDLDGDGINDVNYSATKQNISTVFNILSSKMNDCDDLFIFVTDHGDDFLGISLIKLWNDTFMYDFEFATEVNKINANRINICMAQCNSGGFIDNLQNQDRVIATAAAYNETSYATSNHLYEEFAYHWIAAVSRFYPQGGLANADANNDYKISMQEAFNYASTNDTQNETPQYSSTPTSLGNNLYLANYLKIEGDDVVCDSSIYYVSGIPSTCRVEWLYNYNSAPFPTITHDYPSVNICMIRNPNKFPYSLNLSAVIYCDTIPVDTISRTIVSAQSTFSASYSQEACTYYGVSHPSINSTNVVLGTPIFVHQGCLVTVNSYGFMGRTITHSGVTPQSFYFNGVNQITFSLPLGSGGIPFYIHIGGTGVCQEYDIIFFSASGNGNISHSSKLNITKIGDNKYKFSISLSKEEQTHPEKVIKKEVWEVSIYEAKTGRLVCTKKCFDMPFILDTSKIEKGLYVVRMCSGDDVLTEKFTVTK